MQTSLESFVKSSSQTPQPLPAPLATSTIIEDRKSSFQATLFRARTPTEARTAINHLRRVIHRSNPASHEIAAWRCMVLRQGRTGLGDDDFMLVEGSEDDNEKWAGVKVLGVMKSLAVLDAVVIVSRWYGGTMLGPVRFTHIEDCTRQVCDQIIVKDEIDDSIATLTNLDSTLAALRAELDALRRRPASPPPSARPTDSHYSSATNGGGDPDSSVGETPSAEKTLPPWFQNAQSDAHNPRKRSRSPEHPSSPPPNADSHLNEDNDAVTRTSKRLKPTIPPSAKPPTPELLQPKSVSSPAKAHDYSALLKDLDVQKSRRLITARENAIKSVKTLVVKEKERRRVGAATSEGVVKDGG